MEVLVVQQLLDWLQLHKPIQLALMIIDWKACIFIELKINFFSSYLLWFKIVQNFLN